MIFRRYAELGSVTLLQEELDRLGIRSKRREGAGGRLAGGRPFTRGILYLILQNRLYRGEVAHKGNVYPGQHDAIVDAKLWTVVQERLAANRKARSLAVGAEEPSLLSGLIFDRDGNRMTPTHANKRGRRYRYYISAALLGRGSVGLNTMRVPAGEIEGLVFDQILKLLGSRHRLAEALTPLGLPALQLEQALGAADHLVSVWHCTQASQRREWVRRVVSRVALALAQIKLNICTSNLAAALGCRPTRAAGVESMLVLPVAAKLHRSGKGKRIVIGEATAEAIDPVLVRLIQEAFAIRGVVLSDTRETLNEITARRKKSKGYLTALMRLSYLAPDIIADILDGRQPPELSAKQLLRSSGSLPLEWRSQRAHLRFASAASRD